MRKRLLTRCVAVVLLFSTAGCYQMIPLQSAAPAPNTRIIAQLTDQGTVTMSDMIGSGAVGVEGVIANANTEEWTMHMLRVDHRDGSTIDWNRELVTFPRVSLVDAMERRTNKKKSWLAAVLIVGASIAAASAFQLIGGDDIEGVEPVPQEMLIPGGGK